MQDLPVRMLSQYCNHLKLDIDTVTLSYAAFSVEIVCTPTVFYQDLTNYFRAEKLHRSVRFTE